MTIFPSTIETLTTVLSFHPKALAYGVTKTTKLSCHLTSFLTFLLLIFKTIPNEKLERHVIHLSLQLMILNYETK